MSRASELRKLLDDLIIAAFEDGQRYREEYGPTTSRIRNTIIERYGEVDSEQGE